MIVDYLIPDVLPSREVTILAGAAGAGKTCLVMQLLATSQAGGDVAGLALRRGIRIAYLASDRGWDIAQFWADRAGVRLDDVKHFALCDELPRTQVRRIETDPFNLLLELLDRLLPYDLVIVDPIAVYFGVDLNKYNQVAAKAIELNQWCREKRVTILGTHHAGKARTDYTYKRQQDRISGSAALHGYTATQMLLDTPEETGREHYELVICCHTAPPGTVDLARNNETGLFYLAAPPASRDHQILDVIGASTVTLQYLKQHFRDLIPERTLDRMLREMVQAGALEQPRYGAYRRSPASTIAS